MLLVSLLAVGGAAAQQGFILEPWRPLKPAAASTPARATSPARAAVAASSSATRAVSPAAPLPTPAPTSAAPPWQPPVVALLVDPWAKADVGAAPGSSNWVPHVVEIVDPWKEARGERQPVAASAPTGRHPTTIF